MRITVIRTPDVPIGCGAALVASALAAAGHRVRMVTDAPDAPELVAPRSGPGALRVQPAAVTGPEDLTAAWADEPPDVVHAVGPMATAAAAGTGVPVVVAVPPGTHGPRPPLPAGVARVLAASEDQHTALLGHGVPRALLRTVPAGVDTDAYAPDGPSLRRGEHPRLVATGPLEHGSGVASAIVALSRVPAAELLITGGDPADDPDRERLFAAAEDLGVAGRVRFLGPVGADLLPRLLRSADVVVAAAKRDVPATAVLQAMACARPVVAAAVGGFRDAVVDRVTGLHVRPGTPVELAAAVRELLADDAMRIGYGIAGRDRACSRFDRARIADALVAVYSELVPVAAADGPDDPETATEAEPAGLPG
ncbi:glycosyltransferase family 4 protein [Pseudonocardia nantongensis]|uniref:glycosyltransferase family 4 protein n=1 Tax=Pseudonocardia nantongensis TaxID=1181885 RepID=UPI00397ABC27